MNETAGEYLDGLEDSHEKLEAEVKTLESACDRWVEAEKEWEMTKGVLEAAIEAKEEVWDEERDQLILDSTNALLAKDAEWDELCEERDIRIAELESGNAAWQSIADQKDEIMVEQRKQLATAQAQVAETQRLLVPAKTMLQQWLDTLPESVTHKSGEELAHGDRRYVGAILTMVTKALSAAPKVVWSGEAMVQMNYNLYLGAEGQEAVKGHRKLDVIVLDKQGEGAEKE